MPWFKLDGAPFVGLRAATSHMALTVWSDTVLDQVADLLTDYETGQGTVRFSSDEPLPDAVVGAVMDARAAEIRTSDRHP